MAGDWIKMRCNLSNDPRVLRMACDLGLKPLDIVGRLHAIWSWADSHSVDGHGVTVTKESLDAICFTAGFSQSLESVGWLEESDGKITFSNFFEHNGTTAKARALSTKRKQKERSGESRINRDKNVTREEKRREEKEDVETPPIERKVSDDDLATAKYIWNEIQRLQPSRKTPNLARWANDVRLMRERDSRDDAMIRRVFDAANQDSFWQKNIVSPGKLRKQFDDLALKLNVEKPKERNYLPAKQKRNSNDK